jgi:repressor LexA
MQLTDTQHAILAMIAERIEVEGLPPSQTEIARAFGFRGVRAAQYHLEALEAAGAIERMPGRARGIRVRVRPGDLPAAGGPAASPERAATVSKPAPGRAAAAPHTAPDATDEGVRLPVLGRVSAGLPIGTDIDHDTRLLVDRWLFSPMPDYLLRVEGDSMRDEGILDGDLVGVRQAREARSGQVVVARIEDEITIKQLELRRGGVRLLARNPDYAPIEVRPDQDFAIEGLYCGLVRPNR